VQAGFYFYGTPGTGTLEQNKAGHIETLGLTMQRDQMLEVFSSMTIVPDILSERQLADAIDTAVGSSSAAAVSWFDWLRVLRECIKHTKPADANTRVGQLLSRMVQHNESDVAINRLWQRRLIGFHHALRQHIAVGETSFLLGHLWRFFSLPRKNDFDTRVFSQQQSMAAQQAAQAHHTSWQASPGESQKQWKSFVAPMIATEGDFDGVMPLRGLRALCAELVLPEGAISAAEITAIVLSVSRPDSKPVLAWDAFIFVLASVARVVFGGPLCCALASFDMLLTGHLLPLARSCAELPDDPTHPRSIAQANAQPSAPSMPSSPPRRWAKLPVWAVMTFEQHQECATLGLDDIISHYVGHPEHAFSLQQLHALLDDAQLVPHAASDVEALLLAHAQEGHSDFFAVTRRDFARLLARVAQKISLADKVTPGDALWRVMGQHLAPLVRYLAEDPIADRLEVNPLTMFEA